MIVPCMKLPIIITLLLSVGTGFHVAGTADAVARFNWDIKILSYSAIAFVTSQILVLILIQKYYNYTQQKGTALCSVIAMAMISGVLSYGHNQSYLWILFAGFRGGCYAIITHYIHVVLISRQKKIAVKISMGYRYAALCAGSILAPFMLSMGIGLQAITLVLIACYLIVFLQILVMQDPELTRKSYQGSNIKNAMSLLGRHKILWLCAILSGALGEAPFYYAVEIGTRSGLSEDVAQYILIAMLVGGSVIQPYLAKKNLRYTWISLTLSFVSLLFMVPTYSHYHLILTGLITGALTASCATTGTVWVTRIFPAKLYSEAIAMALLLYFIGYGSGTVAMGYTISYFGVAGFPMIMIPCAIGIGVGVAKMESHVIKTAKPYV